MTRPLDAQARGRWSLLVDLAWRAVQVFAAAMLTELAAADFLPSIRTVQFWQDCVGAAITAAISLILGLAAEGAGLRRSGGG